MNYFLKVCSNTSKKNCVRYFIRQKSKTGNEMITKTPGVRKTPALPKPVYGGRHMVTMIPGSKVGQELMVALEKVFTFAGAPINFETVDIDYDKDDSDGLNNAVTSVIRNGVGIKGFIEFDFNKNTSAFSREMILRNQLDLYVNLMKCQVGPEVHSRHKNLDLVIIRQNTEGEYSMLEHQNVTGTVENLKIVTRTNSARIARFAFEYARKHKRRKVTIIHKADIFHLSDGLFLETCRKIAREYPDLEHDDILIDSCCLHLVIRPQQFDVLIMTNLYGTVVTNIVIGLANGGGILSSRNYSDKFALFEPAKRFCDSAMAGKNIVNPIVILNAGVDLLNHLGLETHADVIFNAVKTTLYVNRVHTPDLGGTATTSQVIDSVLKNIAYSTFIQR